MLFEQIDTVLAFVAIMLLLSLLITAVVQLVVAFLGLRGRNLRWGLEQLLGEAAPTLARHKGATGAVAKLVLGQRVWATSTDPLIAIVTWVLARLPAGARRPVITVVGWLTGGRGLSPAGRRAPVQVRSEDVQLVLDDLVGSGAVEKALAAWFPGDVRALAAGARQELTPERVKAAFEDWFELVMDATSERFKLWSRWLTAVAAFVLAFGMQVDAVSLFERLSNDPAAVAAIVDRLPALDQLNQALENEITAAAPTDDAAERARVERLKALLITLRSETAATGIDLLRPQPDWRSFIASLRPVGRAFWGTVATILLLSLGAPFWYGTLRGLLRLRSVMAEKSGT